MRVSIFLAGCALASAGSVPLVTFDGAAVTTRVWREQNDPVMGGESTGQFSVQGGLGIFEGEVVNVPFLQAPGFIKASTVDAQPFPDITSCSALAITARAASNYSGFRLSFGTAHAPGGKTHAFGYKASFKLAVGSFGSVSVPLQDFTDFWDDATGEAIVTCRANATFCPDAAALRNIGTIAVWAEGVGGKVHLEIREISAEGCSAASAVASTSRLGPLQGLGKGRVCPAWPKTAAACPLKNITDVYGEFEPVCVLHFPQVGGELAEVQARRCMPGEKAPYFKDSQGVFRCSCCGAPLWRPSQQFDQLPADRWPWPSFHSPPIMGSDGLPSVCHRGHPTPGVPNRNATIDLGLGATGEVGCASCGAHLGDYFDSDEDGHDHYCINGVCMVAPGAALGTTCTPTVPPGTVVV